MINPILVITAVVFAIFIIIASIYFLVYYQHPDDKLIAWFPKFVVVAGLSVSAYNIFLLPLDVAISKGEFYSGESTTFGMVSIAFYLITTAFILVFVPFAIFWYEGYDVDDSDDPDAKRPLASQIAYTLKWLIPIDLFAAFAIGLLWYLIGYADIPVTLYTSPFQKVELVIPGTYADQIFSAPLVDSASNTILLTAFTTLKAINTSSLNLLDICSGADTCTRYSAIAEVRVSSVVYIVALMSLAGWVVFSIFGGIGMITLPVDYINDFLHRPKPIAKDVYLKRKTILGEQSGLLMEVGEQIQTDIKSNGHGKMSKGMAKKEKAFRRDVIILEYHYRKLEEAFKSQGGNVLVHYGKLLGGIIAAILTIAWIFHMILYILPVYLFSVNPFSPFLNSFFEGVSIVPFVGTAFYALFTFYLLFCVIKGVLKVGFRILFITIHPMRIGETMMSSLVFNTGVILISSLAAAQFNTIAFSIYAQFTASNQSIFGVNTQYMRYLRYAFFVFNFLILGFAFLTGFYVLFNPYKKQKENRLNFKW